MKKHLNHQISYGKLALRTFAMIIVTIIIFSCNNETDEPHESVKLKILPTVGISVDNYIQLRNSTSLDTVYAVQIYEEGVPYYYGLFNDVNKMEISLTTNKKYSFKIAAYRNGSGLGLKSNTANGLTSFFLPDTVSLLNKFVKGDKLKEISTVSNAKLIENKYSLYPEIDVFYQETEVAVIKGMSSIVIPLKRTGFGLGISVDGLTTGKLEIYFAGDTINLSATKKSYFSIRSFVGGTNGLADVASVDTYYVNLPISIKWIGDNGTIVTASNSIKLKRNYQLPLNININTTSTGVTFEGWQNDISGAVTDIDGNVYNTVQIGTQIWMTENLKVTHYRDGTAIPNITNTATWEKLTTGGYENFANNSSYKQTYGLFYNWYAATDVHNIAPYGWHVPTDTEWNTLTTYLGGPTLAGGKLKEAGTVHWRSPNTGATNSSGFSAIPNPNGDYAYYWSSTGKDSTSDWARNLNYYYNYFFKDVNGDLKNSRLSIRCLKD